MATMRLTVDVETGPGVTRQDMSDLLADLEKYARVVLLADRERFKRPGGDDELYKTWHKHKGRDGCDYCMNTAAVDRQQTD